MAEILYFDSNSKPSVLVLPSSLSDRLFVSFKFYLFKLCNFSSVRILSSAQFRLSLSYQNTLRFSDAQQNIQVSDTLVTHQWHTVLISPDEIIINSTTTPHTFPINFDSISKLTIGSENIPCLIQLPLFNISQDPLEIRQNFETCESSPLKSLEELYQWKPTVKGNVSRVPLRLREKKSPKELLVCHDCGPVNYKEDVGIVDLGFCYRYLHWAQTDIFMYFSHFKLSIPPVGYIDSCHRNGVHCLGTYITEGDDNYIDSRKLLENKEVYTRKLVEVMNYHGFDGYLINIESPVDDARKIAEWLRYLTEMAHQANPKSLIIWYDSIIMNGQVRWQSQLNDQNSIFFTNCDGFFTDYHWQKGMPRLSAQRAGTRNWKVYTGTDLFGRGTYGGGGFNTKIGALHSENTSVALFAPAWTWEGPGHMDWKAFIEAEKGVWCQSSFPLIDPAGLVHENRPATTKDNLINAWTVEVFQGNMVPGNDNWVQVNNKKDFWCVNDDLSCTSSFVYCKRKVAVNLTQIGKITNRVTGTVEVKGTGPKTNDFYRVILECVDNKGKKYVKEDTGYASGDWKSISLEIRAESIVMVTWSEIGKDAEYWAGHYGSCFRNTYVVGEESGASLLQQFEERTHKELIGTWFGLGQGPRLMARGGVIKDSRWNSMRDSDILPDFRVVALNSFSFDKVYHGTNSIAFNQGTWPLFVTDFMNENTNIRLIYWGNIKLLVENAQFIRRQSDKGWSIDYYKHSGPLQKIQIEVVSYSYLGGLHIYDDREEVFDLSVISQQICWNPASLDSGSLIFDLKLETNELPPFVRHLDVYHTTFLTRGYEKWVKIDKIQSNGKDVKLRIEAENMIGEVISSVELVIPFSEIFASKPF